MCGLFGIAGDMNYKDGDLVKMLALFSSTRGEDSTGAASVQTNSNEIVVAKTLGHPYNLFDSRIFDSKVNNLHNKKALIGHCRKATSGSVKISNAHPFAFGEDFVGVHNGTLRAWQSLPFRDEHDIDSQVLLRNIYERGATEVIPTVEGAYALVWYKGGDEDRLYFLRNNERTLYYAFSKNCKQIIWASERWMIQIACAKNGKELYTDEEGRSIFLFDKDMLYGFHLPQRPVEQIEIEVETNLEGKKSVIGHRVTGYYGACGVSNSNSCGDVTSPFVLTPPEDPDDRAGVTRTVGKELPPLLQAPTPKADESKATESATKSSSSKSSTSQKRKGEQLSSSSMTSSSPRPTLSLVPTGRKKNSKKSGILPSNSEASSLDDPLPADLAGEEMVYGPTGGYINKEDYDQATKYGCDWCGEDVSFEEAQKGGLGLWFGPKNFLCSNCLEHSHYAAGTNR